MARKAEIGIQYYPCNTDHITNRKIKLLFSKFKAEGFWIYECLKCEAFRVKGYFVDTRDRDEMIIFAQDTCKLPLELVDAVIQECVNRDLFDKGMFEKYGILTSDRIQENYLGGTSRRQHGVEMVREYLLIDPTKFEKIVIVNINGESVNIIDKNADIKTDNVPHQDTKKKEKENRLKGEGEGETVIPPELFKELFSWLKEPKQQERFYAAERKRAQSEMMDWQREKSITQELLESNPELNRQNYDHMQWLFKKHIGNSMTTEIEDCFMHYARTDFMINDAKIKKWIPVLSGWMKQREKFQSEKSNKRKTA
jgi:hypothetical protein